MRRFSLYPRGKVLYVQFYNPSTHTYSSGRSTGQSSRDMAAAVVLDWLKNGIPAPGGEGRRSVGLVLEVDTIMNAICSAPLTEDDAGRIVGVLRQRRLIETAVIKSGPSSEPLIPFLLSFWDYEKSPYVRDKLSHGQRMGRRHCYDMTRLVRTVWREYFTEDRRLGDVRRADIAAFALWLREEKGWQPKTVNTGVAAGSVAFRWAHESELIASNPAAGLMHFSGKPAKRGVLTEEEVKRLFELEWPDERSRTGNAAAMCSGLRAGEILGLQYRDIGPDRLFIRHSWSDQDGLKGTKTDEERTVPLVASVRRALLRLARKNPHGVGPTSFVFWSVCDSSRPMDFHFLLDGLKDALVRHFQSVYRSKIGQDSPLSILNLAESLPPARRALALGDLFHQIDALGEETLREIVAHCPAGPDRTKQATSHAAVWSLLRERVRVMCRLVQEENNRAECAKLLPTKRSARARKWDPIDEATAWLRRECEQLYECGARLEAAGLLESSGSKYNWTLPTQSSLAYFLVTSGFNDWSNLGRYFTICGEALNGKNLSRQWSRLQNGGRNPVVPQDWHRVVAAVPKLEQT